MAKPLLTKTPLVAVAAVVIVFLVLAGLKIGFETATLAIVILAGLTVSLAWLSFALNKEFKQYDKQTRQARFAAERMQTLLQTAPGGYCIFTPQGLLREATRMTPILGIEKVSHFDDIVAALKEPSDFVAAFRKLQQTGDKFSMQVPILRSDLLIQIIGRRFRVGREGPLIDALWFYDNPGAQKALDKVSAALAEAETRVQQIRLLLDRMPFPVWVRGNDLNIVLCNQTYAAALDATAEDVLRHQHELASQTAPRWQWPYTRRKCLELSATSK
jgi:PAS domain-containing protein